MTIQTDQIPSDIAIALTDPTTRDRMQWLIEKAMMEKSLPDFIRGAWHVVEPGNEYIPGWHIDYMSEHLEAVSNGEILRLLITIPPRYMKSLVTSVLWPTWTWATKPEKRWMFLSHSGGLAEKHNEDRRQVILSPWYQERWGNIFKLSRVQNTKGEFQNSARGHMTTSSFAGSPIGKGGNIVVIDDPMSPDTAMSPAGRKHTIDFYRGSVVSRLDDKKLGAIVCIMQRLHSSDLAGELIDSGFTHVNLPNPAPAKRTYHFPRSGKNKTVEEGEPLWEARENKDDLAVRERDMGPVTFAAQYGQNPVPEGGLIFNPDWWKRYDESPYVIKRSAKRVVQFWDTAYSEKDGSSFSVCSTWAEYPDKLRVLDVWEKRVPFPELQEKAIELYREWGAVSVQIEPKASGLSLVQAMVAVRIPAEAMKMPAGDKVTHANAVTGFIKTGIVEIPYSNHVLWVPRFVKQHAEFPNSQNDDIVDTTSMAIHYFELQPKVDGRGYSGIGLGVVKDNRFKIF